MTRFIPIFFVIALIGIRLALIFTTYGTNDVYAFERSAIDSSSGAGLYVHDSIVERPGVKFNLVFTPPPFMIRVLAAELWISRHLHIPFQIVFRFPCVLADCLTGFLLWRMKKNWLMVLACPAAILITGFHGNTDAVMIALVVLAVYLVDRYPVWAGMVFAVACSIKIVPLILVPVLIGKRRLDFFLAAGVSIIVLWSPYIFQEPVSIFQKVLAYKSLYGYWGLSALAVRFGSPEVNIAVQRYGTTVLMAVISGMAWLTRRRSLFERVGIAFFVFLAGATGFGAQYLAWLTPWLVDIGAAAYLFITTSGVFLFLLYNSWAGGLPWWIADSNIASPSTGQVLVWRDLCWLSVAGCAIALWRKKGDILPPLFLP